MKPWMKLLALGVILSAFLAGCGETKCTPNGTQSCPSTLTQGVPYTGATSGTVWFRAEGVTTGIRTVSLTGLSYDLDLDVYTKGGGTTLGSSHYLLALPEYVTVSVPTSGTPSDTLDIKVHSFWGYNSNYTLLLY